MLMGIKFNSILVLFLQQEHASRHKKNIYQSLYQFTDFNKIRRNLFLSFIVQSTRASFANCIARETLCFKKLLAMGSSVVMLKGWGRPQPENPKPAIEKDLSIY